MGLGRAWDGDHTLRDDPSKSYLSNLATSSFGKLLDFLDDGLVLVKILTLKFGTRSSEVAFCEVIRRLVVKVVDKPAMA